MNNMMERLETIARRYEELNEILMDPSIANDVQKMTEAPLRNRQVWKMLISYIKNIKRF